MPVGHATGGSGARQWRVCLVSAGLSHRACGYERAPPGPERERTGAAGAHGRADRSAPEAGRPVHRCNGIRHQAAHVSAGGRHRGTAKAPVNRN
jgi:hypothetical protein